MIGEAEKEREGERKRDRERFVHYAMFFPQWHDEKHQG